MCASFLFIFSALPPSAWIDELSALTSLLSLFEWHYIGKKELMNVNHRTEKKMERQKWEMLTRNRKRLATRKWTSHIQIVWGSAILFHHVCLVCFSSNCPNDGEGSAVKMRMILMCLVDRPKKSNKSQFPKVRMGNSMSMIASARMSNIQRVSHRRSGLKMTTSTLGTQYRPTWTCSILWTTHFISPAAKKRELNNLLKINFAYYSTNWKNEG